MAQVKKKTTTAKTVKPAVKPKTKKPVKTSKSTDTTEYKTLRPCKPALPFLSTKPTHQTLYWLIVAVLVLVLGAWFVNLQVKINSVYDKIEESQLNYSQISELDMRIYENRKATIQDTQLAEQ